jgi:hypothetical protein
MREVGQLVIALFLGGVLGYFHLGRRAESWFARLANRRALAVALCAAVSMLPRLATLPWLGPPDAKIADEFSTILGAQTFALGRLTNPAPALWQHFETLHVNVLPTYQTMYQPAPSLFLALGIVVGGSPWWGVWLGCGLMCAAICWALQPLIRPKYALLAGLYCAIKYGMFTQYGDSYWGGAVCALGAALTLGSFVRLVRTQRPVYIPVLILGVALLANSRPFEGFLFALPIAIAMLVWTYRTRSYVRVLLPTTALIAVLAAGMAYYNYRTTDHPTLMPYVVNYREYHFVQPFLGMAMLPQPHYRHYQMAKLYRTWEGEPGKLEQTPKGIEFLTINKYKFFYREHFARLMVLALVGLGYALWSGRHKLLASTFLLVMLGLFSVVWWPLSSYAAPLLVSFFGLAFLGLRYVRALRFRGHKVGYYWARGIVLVLAVAATTAWYRHLRDGVRTELSFPPAWNVERLRIIHQLEHQGGRHLLIVKYSRRHNPHQEWVYNPPDIRHSGVILARSMGNIDDCQLMHYYSDRIPWFVYPDTSPWPQLAPADLATMNCRDTDTPHTNVTMVRK